ncbi:DUF2188 domain-containing protein [Maribacter flavus]|uniref:DUF2188 domain-containing protein n=1 Tax=Maribacter flavus TaxID=1658664 RepID=A0A5B2TXJ1_9FLAO|nr:DUF2188 domain-containing protein [Maribacter flavus]KAA2218370.1 DUF2188 domain-containing protein [Maribacter flavus]
MSTGKTFLRTLIELIEIFFNSSRSLKRGRTWNQHVVPYEDAWAVRREGNKRITSKHRKQSTAINKAKALAKKYNADVIIHRENGEIRDRISFNDANPKK